MPIAVVLIAVEARFARPKTAATVGSGTPAASAVRYVGLTGANQGEDWLGHCLGLGVGDASVLRPPREAKRVDCRGGHGMRPALNATTLCEKCLSGGTASAVDWRSRAAPESWAVGK